MSGRKGRSGLRQNPLTKQTRLKIGRETVDLVRSLRKTHTPRGVFALQATKHRVSEDYVRRAYQYAVSWDAILRGGTYMYAKDNNLPTQGRRAAESFPYTVEFVPGAVTVTGQ